MSPFLFRSVLLRPVPQVRNALRFRTVVAAIYPAVLLQTMADNTNAAMRARWGEFVDCAFEAIKSMRLVPGLRSERICRSRFRMHRISPLELLVINGTGRRQLGLLQFVPHTDRQSQAALAWCR